MLLPPAPRNWSEIMFAICDTLDLIHGLLLFVFFGVWWSVGPRREMHVGESLNARSYFYVDVFNRRRGTHKVCSLNMGALE